MRPAPLAPHPAPDAAPDAALHASARVSRSRAARARGLALGAWAAIHLAACNASDLPDPRADPFSPRTTRVVVEVDAQEGAAPFTGDTAYGDTWDLTVDNVRALVGGDVALEVPRTLDEMGALDDVPDGDLSGLQLLDLSGLHLDDGADGDDVARYHVLFLDRFFEQDGARREDVLGVTIGDERVVAMFKPVIDRNAGLFGGGVDRFVEQATMVHELGHAFGLVDNGLEMQRDHKDEDHGAHCANDECVMFFLNEGFADALDFARDALVQGDTVLFDDDCLDDASAARAR